MRRALDRGMFLLALVVSIAATLAVLGLLWLRSPWGNEFLRGQIVTRVGDAMNGEIRLERLEGNPLTGLTLHGFALVDEQGVPLVTAERVRVDYALRPFYDRRIVLDRVRLVKPEINLIRGPDGRWNFQTLWKPRPPATDPAGWGTWIEIHEVELVDGTVDVRLAEGGWPVLSWEENRFVDLNGTLRISIHRRDRPAQRYIAEDLSLTTTAPALPIRRLNGEAIVTPDSLALVGIEFETPGSTVRTDGVLLLAAGDSLAMAVDAPRLDMAEVRAFFPEVRLAGTAEFQGRLEGPVSGLGVVIDRARLDTGRSVVSVEGRIADLAQPVLDLDARAETLAPADVREWVAAYPLEQAVSGTVRVQGPPRLLEVDADLTAPAGAFTVLGRLDLRQAATGYDLAVTSRRLDVGPLLGRPAVDLLLTGRYEIEGRGFGPRDLDARVAGELGPSSIYGRDVVALATRGRLIGRRFVADTVWARTPESVVGATGTWDLSASGGMQVDLDLASEDLSELWPALGDWATRARGEIRLDGPYRGFGVAGTVVAGGLDVAGVEADSFAGDLRLEAVATPAFRAEADGVFYDLRVAGLFADSANVTLAFADERMTVDGVFDLTGDSRASLRAVGDFTGPAAVIALERFEYVGEEQTWRLEEAGRLTWSGGRLRAESVAITQNGQVLRLDGFLGLDPNAASDLTFTAENVALKDVAVLTGQPSGDWEGSATVRGRLTGTRVAPVIEITGEVSEGMIRGFRFVQIAGRVDYRDQVADVDLRVITPEEGHAVVLTGRAPIDLSLVGGVDRLPDRPIDLTIEGEGTDLSLVGAFVPGVTDLSGPVDLRIEISGTSQSPRFEGAVTVIDGRLTIPATGVTYSGIAGRIGMSNDRIVVEELTGTDGDDGRFEVRGEIAVQNLRLGEFDLRATARELDVMDLSRQDIQVNADIEIGGTTSVPVVRGRVEVDEAIYRLPESTGKDVIDLNEAVIYVDIPGAGPTEAIERSASLWSRARVDVDVVVTSDAIIQSNKARIEIAGDLSLSKPSGTRLPTFSGTLQVLRGYYEEFGRRFTIEGGDVFFYGTPDINPGLNIVATQTVENVEGVGDVQVRITLGGTLRNPTIDVSSTPQFDRSEILSIALFGTPRPSAGQERQLQDTAQGLVTGGLLSAAAPLQAALSEELGVDVFEVSQIQDDAGRMATLFRVGKFISPDVYVAFEQEVGANEASRIALRYQITDRWTVQFNAGTGVGQTTEREGFQAGIDLFWEFTY